MLMRTRTRLPVLLILILCAAAGFAQDDPAAVEGAEALLVTIDATGPIWLETIHEDPADPDLEAFAGRLAVREDIASAEVRDNEVQATTSDGIIMCFSAPLPGTLGGGGPVTLMPARTAAAPVTMGEPRCLGDQVPLGKALVIHALPSNYNDIRPDFRTVLEEAGYTVETGDGHLLNFQKLSDAAITVIHCHGGLAEIDGVQHFGIDATHYEDTGLMLEEWYVWLKRHELGIYHRIDWEEQGQPPVLLPTRSYWGATIFDTWFENNIESMVPNSLVMMLTCHSADIDSPWSIFSEKGAGGFLGFTETADAGFAHKWGLNFLKYTLGTSTDRPSPAAPYHRAWSLKDAFDCLEEKPGFDLGYDWSTHPKNAYHKYKRATPVMKKYWEAPDFFSVAPHIDDAGISRAENGIDYTINLWGAFGLAEDCEVLVGGTPVPFEDSGGGGAPLKVMIPPDAVGDLVVVDKWGRESNPVTISEFNATMDIDYSDMMAEGDIELEYRELVVGSRLYMGLTEDLIYAGLPAYCLDEMLMYWQLQGGLPGMNTLFKGLDIREMGYPLVSGKGDWDLRWHFDSRKRFGAAVIHAVADEHITGQGGGPGGDEEPGVAFLVMLDPAYGDVQAPECDAQVNLAVNVPVEMRTSGGIGGVSAPQLVGMGGQATVRYDQRDGVLPAIVEHGFNARWTMPEVHLVPDPCDFSKRH
ncbi:MAG: hypothetical protein ACQER1_13905 [Armatimonadota bacterium]